ncbi:MAG: type II toxin-antitoxin system HicB family antitoxin [Dehalococcoidia bacterium]
MAEFEIRQDGVTYRFETTEQGYFAEVPDLPGCLSEGATLDEAFANIREALALFVEGSLAEGLPVPEPFRRMFAQAV